MIKPIAFRLLQAIRNSQQKILSPSFAKICTGVCSTSTSNHLFKKFRLIGLVKTEKCGRKFKVNLTNKGEEVLKSLEVIKRAIG